MAFTWTAPDPLNNTAKTKSIYITEIQDAVNVRRDEIGQGDLTFVDQGVGKSFRLDAIEELKVFVNQLALDFGYGGGVEHVDLLGRPYVTLRQLRGFYVTFYPIINDLRIVLEALVSQVGATFIAGWWYDVAGGLGTLRPIASWEQDSGNPYTTTPVDSFIPGVGGTIPFFRGTLIDITDLSIRFFDLNTTTTREGPLIGPWFDSGDTTYTDAPDALYYYGILKTISGSPNTYEAYRQLRDGSEDPELLTTFQSNENSFGIEAGPDHILLLGRTRTEHFRISKTPGGGVIDSFNSALLSNPLNPKGIVAEAGGSVTLLNASFTFDRYHPDGGVVGLYEETWKEFRAVSDPATFHWTVLSGLYRLPEDATDWTSLVLVQDFAEDTVTGLNGEVSLLAKHINNIWASGSGGFWYDVRDVGAQAHNFANDGPTPVATVQFTWNGAPPDLVGINDYQGEPIWGSAKSYMETYVDWNASTGNEVTPTFNSAALVLDSAIRTDNPVVESADITWTHVPGAFRYDVLRRAEGSGVASSVGTVESIGPLSFTVPGLQKTQNYYLSVRAETAQGRFNGVETFVPIT